MDDRSRKLLIVGLVVVVLGGGAAYFLGVYQPRKAREAAQTEIAAWEGRWQKARECLVGSAQASTDVGEAMAIRDLGADLTNRGGCSKLIGNLTRGQGDATELDGVERAWQAIDFAAGKVATSYVTQTSPTKKTEQESTDALATALAEMDSAHAALRAAASMGALPPRAKAALPKATLVPVTHGSSPVTVLQSVAISNGAIYARGGTASASVTIVHAPGKAPIVMQTGAAHRSLPDLGWGVVASADQLQAGSLDDAGQLTAPVSLRLRQPATVLFAIGNAKQGAIALSIEGDRDAPTANAARLVIGRSIDGVLSLEIGQPFAELRYDVDPAGRALLAWSDATGKLSGAILETGGPLKIEELGTGSPDARDRGCLTQARGWIGTQDQFIAFGDAPPAPRVFPDHVLIGCSRDAALLHASGSMKFAACSDQCRVIDLGDAHPASIAVLIAADDVRAIAGRRKVIAMWSPKGAPTYFAVEQPFTPMYAVSDGKTIDVLGRSGQHVAIVRLPAS